MQGCWATMAVSYWKIGIHSSHGRAERSMTPGSGHYVQADVVAGPAKGRGGYRARGGRGSNWRRYAPIANGITASCVHFQILNPTPWPVSKCSAGPALLHF